MVQVVRLAACAVALAVGGTLVPPAAIAAAAADMPVTETAPASQSPFSQQAFQAAQAAGMPILVHVTAPWCPTCAKQKPILSRLEADPTLAHLQVFDVDFDTQKDVLRALGVQMQSTLIVYHGKAERGRSTGVVDEGKLKDLLDQSNG